MRRNRRGPGASGSTSFLTRALRCTEADLRAGVAALGLVIPEKPNDRPINTVIGEEVWWPERRLARRSLDQRSREAAG
jgi:hypothetical protein